MSTSYSGWTEAQIAEFRANRGPTSEVGGIMGDGTIRYETVEGVMTLTLDSPETRNSLSLSMLDTFLNRVAEADNDSTVRCVVITAEGSVFSSGANLNADSGDRDRAVRAYPELLKALIRLRKPVICRVNGHVRAGGTSLVAASDVAVAADHATFAFPEVRLGVSPAIVAAICLPISTPRLLQRYLLTGETFTAGQAAEAGLVSLVVPAGVLDERVRALVEDVTKAGPAALAATKKLITETRFPDLDDTLASAAVVSAELFGSSEAEEGLRAFKERRRPHWASISASSR